MALEPGKRHLVAAAGKPLGDSWGTAWSLIAEPTRDEVEVSLGDWRARGFNAIWSS